MPNHCRRGGTWSYNRQPQPRRLMDLVDGLHPAAGRSMDRGAPTRLLRRSLQSSGACRL
ncbi:hypothetical protein [Streptomyces virginiae]|uniref:hypothetical protein n=1 Tax=Streptomyces virginiae TaxID=1961 RepID=UPI003448EED5